MINRCDNCKYNNTQKAKEMFFKQYCDLKDCVTDGKDKCKYKVRNNKFNLYHFILGYIK